MSLSNRVKEAEPEARLDIRDSEHVWCTGVVKLKIAYASGPPGLLVHFEVNIRHQD